MSNNSGIGFFDSGVGGLSVLARFKKVLPNENILYFGDLKNLPYGNKTPDELVGFARNILNFFETKNVKAVVIACNTSSALAYEKIKDEYNFKIYPIIQSCAKVIAGMNYSKIGVFATQGTVNSGVYKRELLNYDNKLQVKEIACPNWVNIVEGVWGKSEDACLADIKLHLDEMSEFNPDKIILGCTHYPYLLDKLENFVSKDLFIDPAELFVNYIKEDLAKEGLLANNETGIENFYVSANPQSFVENSALFYKVKQLPLII